MSELLMKDGVGGWERDAIIICDHDERVTYLNGTAVILHGFAEGDGVGRQLAEMFRQPVNAEQLRVARESLREQGEWRGRIHWRGADGEDITAGSCWTLVRDGNDAPLAILIVNRDLTQERLSEKERFSRRNRESLGALAVGIAHQLNDIFAPVMLALDKGVGNGRNRLGRRGLLSVRDSVRTGAELVSQILEFATQEPDAVGRVRPDLLVRSLEGFLNKVLSKSIQVRIHTEKDLPVVRANGSRLYQILLELTLHALRHFPHTGILGISAGRMSFDRQYALMSRVQPGDHVVFTISMGERQKTRGGVHGPDVKDGQAADMLRDLSREVEMLGGALKTRERGGGEVDFIVILRAMDVNRSLRIGVKAERTTGKGEVILVVDDEAAIRESTKMTLQAAGYTVLMAGDGAEATALYAEQCARISAVLIDIMMPHMMGDAAIRTMIQINPEVRIIATSGYATSEKLSRIIDLERVRMLHKPYTAGTLLAAVRGALTDRGHEHTAAEKVTNP